MAWNKVGSYRVMGAARFSVGCSSVRTASLGKPCAVWSSLGPTGERSLLLQRVRVLNSSHVPFEIKLLILFCNRIEKKHRKLKFCLKHLETQLNFIWLIDARGINALKI